MKKIYIISTITFLLLFGAGFPGVFEAVANDNSCRFKATSDDVFLRIFDRDRSGNTINDGNYYRKHFLNERPLWEGALKKGQTQSIKSSNGEVRYDYKAASDDRGYGNNTASCTHGETIRLP